jgi:hypothetical protein
MRALPVFVFALVLAGCGAATTEPTETDAIPTPTGHGPTPTATPAQTGEESGPMSLEEIRASDDDGEITMDLFRHTDTVQARFVDAVYEEWGGETPLGFTDRSLLQWAIDTCEDPNAAVPAEWEAAPGQTEAEVQAVAAGIAAIAQTFICDEL